MCFATKAFFLKGSRFNSKVFPKPPKTNNNHILTGPVVCDNNLERHRRLGQVRLGQVRQFQVVFLFTFLNIKINCLINFKSSFSLMRDDTPCDLPAGHTEVRLVELQLPAGCIVVSHMRIKCRISNIQLLPHLTVNKITHFNTF